MKMHSLHCACCGPVTEKVLWAEPVSEEAFAKRIASRLSNSLLVTFAQKAEEDGGENGGDEFLDEELALAALLALLLFTRGQAAKTKLFDLFDTENASTALMDDALIEFEKAMKAPLSNVEKNDFKAIIGRLMNTGASQVQGGLTGTNISNTAGVGTIMDGYPTVGTSAAFLYLRLEEAILNFTERFVSPGVRSGIENVLANTNPTAPHSYTDLKFLVDSRLQGTAYWDVVANATASRSYHYGLLKAANIQNFRTYAFVAVIDNVTTPICRALNGRTFRVQTALDLMEDAFASEDLDTYKDIMPWFTSAEGIEEADETTLASAGIMIPPLHARCRSTIRLIA